MAEALTEIKTQLARLDDLLQDYLSLARVATSERTPQDLGAMVQGWAQEWLRLSAPHRVMLRVEGIADLGTVAFHPSTLRRALLNLVQNALDAMPEGGTLTLRGAGTATHVQLQVCDTGSGIPDRAAGADFRAVAYHKTGRHRTRPLYHPGNRGRPWRADHGTECGRPGHHLYPHPAPCRSMIGRIDIALL